MIIKANDRFYIFEFGLKELMFLKEYINLKEDDIQMILYCGLLKNHPNITLSEVELISRSLTEEQIALLSSYKNKTISKEKIAELYAKAIGEVGIQPSSFWSMTEEEIDWAYEGYMGRKEAEANLMVMALDWSRNKNPNLIKLTEDKGYEVGSMEDRKLTFQALGIEGKNDKINRNN